MVLGQGAATGTLEAGDVQQLLAQACDLLMLLGKRVLVIGMDGPRGGRHPAGTSRRRNAVP